MSSMTVDVGKDYQLFVSASPNNATVSVDHVGREAKTLPRVRVGTLYSPIREGALYWFVPTPLASGVRSVGARTIPSRTKIH